MAARCRECIRDSDTFARLGGDEFLCVLPAVANQQMADIFTAHPDLDAFILVGGWAQFGPQAYAQNTDQVKAKLDSKELVIIAGDTLPPQIQAFKEGRSHAQIGQRPYQMGNEAPDVLIKLINGEAVEDPIYTGLDVCSTEDAGICK